MKILEGDTQEVLSYKEIAMEYLGSRGVGEPAWKWPVDWGVGGGMSGMGGEDPGHLWGGPRGKVEYLCYFR